jgi:phage FluMu gp28-like protein
MDVDQTGMGLALCEFLQRKFGPARVGGVTFTGPARVEMAKRIKARFEDKLIRIPADQAIRDDFRLVKKEDTLSSERIVIEESGESHADRFWAAALGVYAHYETTAAIGLSPETAPRSAGVSSRDQLRKSPAAALARRMLPGRAA